MSYFKPEEFACRCGRKECDAPKMNPMFVAKLNLLRQVWGVPLIVLSGSRCAYHNAEVGGSDKSQHLIGNAADLRISGIIEGDQLVELAVKIGFHGIGVAKTFIHVDDGPPNRRWTYA